MSNDTQGITVEAVQASMRAFGAALEQAADESKAKIVAIGHALDSK